MVKVYSKYNCKNCKQVKRLLKFSGIDYIEINVEDDEEAFKYIKEGLGFSNLPVIVAQDVEPFEFNSTKVNEFVKGYTHG
ncbi:putative ribonucleotide diphosphate reductase glutaredoxin subunit [Lactococcus phage 949]|uniref:Putative ribonucleotide diphosphate reductase glutaredoxin subunit n=1 Tax=Lactococcus phage 949 TaxID=881953 RepID=E0YIZ4_9CAUD|nr:putative ribonucleotide diphosphate reductase glutaredoxin subunit [Lactococcus phage 949]ADM73665.1 putative ribonucleotide diphosphate reductase glutaredoxin subunit [Lactococcus phage 949]